MTIVAAVRFPEIIGEKATDLNQSIVMVSDSRITLGVKNWDIAIKLHQLSSDSILGYAGNVKLAQEVLKSIHYNLSVKERMFDGHQAFLKYIGETINYKRKKIGPLEDLDYDAYFLLSLLADENKPSLYIYSHIFDNNYSPVHVGRDEPFKIIGQTARERDQYYHYLEKAIEEFKVNDSLTCSTAMRKAMNDYILGSSEFPIRRSVGGLIQAMSISPRPVEVEDINTALIDPVTNRIELTKMDYERQSWVKYIGQIQEEETYKYPLERMKDLDKKIK